MLHLALYSLCFTLPIFSPWAKPFQMDGGSLEATDEYRIKLALIEKFTVHIEWPKGGRVNEANEPFYFGVYNDTHPFGEALSILKNERQLKWKKVEVRFFEAVEDFEVIYPDLLFVPAEHSADVPAIAQALGNKPTLIIAEERGLTEKGAMMTLFLREEKMRFEINEEILYNKGFKVSAELARLSD